MYVIIYASHPQFDWLQDSTLNSVNVQSSTSIEDYCQTFKESEQNIEEMEGLGQVDFDDMVSMMDKKLEEYSIPIERLRNLDLIVFDNSIRYNLVHMYTD